VGEYLRPLLAAADAAVAAAAARAALAAAAHADGALAPLAAAAAAALAELWDAPARAPARGQLLDALACALPVLEARRPADPRRARVFVGDSMSALVDGPDGGREQGGGPPQRPGGHGSAEPAGKHRSSVATAPCSRTAAEGVPVRPRVQPSRPQGRCRPRGWRRAGSSQSCKRCRTAPWQRRPRVLR